MILRVVISLILIVPWLFPLLANGHANDQNIGGIQYLGQAMLIAVVIGVVVGGILASFALAPKDTDDTPR